MPHLLLFGPTAHAAGGLRVFCNMNGASVWLDGKAEGSCPAKIVTSADSHTLEVRKPIDVDCQYYFKTEVNLREGQPQKLDVELNRTYTEDGWYKRGNNDEYLQYYPNGKYAKAIQDQIEPDPSLAPLIRVALIGNAAPSLESQWISVDEASRMSLAFDHSQILASAVTRLAEPFTLPQLQSTYEIVLGRAMDKSAYRKRMLDANFLAAVGSTDGTMGRVAMAYYIKDRSQAITFP